MTLNPNKQSTLPSTGDIGSDIAQLVKNSSPNRITDGSSTGESRRFNFAALGVAGALAVVGYFGATEAIPRLSMTEAHEQKAATEAQASVIRTTVAVLENTNPHDYSRLSKRAEKPPYIIGDGYDAERFIDSDTSAMYSRYYEGDAQTGAELTLLGDPEAHQIIVDSYLPAEASGYVARFKVGPNSALYGKEKRPTLARFKTAFKLPEGIELLSVSAKDPYESEEYAKSSLAIDRAKTGNELSLSLVTRDHASLKERFIDAIDTDYNSGYSNDDSVIESPQYVQPADTNHQIDQEMHSSKYGLIKILRNIANFVKA